jgi:hypothetical protein
VVEFVGVMRVPSDVLAKFELLAQAAERACDTGTNDTFAPIPASIC